jgi:hypothetical protein
MSPIHQPVQLERAIEVSVLAEFGTFNLRSLGSWILWTKQFNFGNYENVNSLTSWIIVCFSRRIVIHQVNDTFLCNTPCSEWFIESPIIYLCIIKPLQTEELYKLRLSIGKCILKLEFFSPRRWYTCTETCRRFSFKIILVKTVYLFDVTTDVLCYIHVGNGRL